MQLTPAPPGADGWSAGVWVDIIRDGSSLTGWSSAGGPASNTPWCPGEPNDRFSNEDCAVVLTFCTGGASAAVNDFDCDRTSRCVLLPGLGGQHHALVAALAVQRTVFQSACW
jgi:hypothetical protein